MRNKIFTLISVLTIAGSLMAAVGPQSVKVTFNGNNSEGWVVASPGTLSSVGSGVANVTMAIPSGKDKYRADFQYNTAGTYTFSKAKDVVWAIKLTAALPGSSNSRKFELQYNDGSDHWINNINNPSGDLTCADGGKIYYFNLGSDGLNKLSDVPDGAVNIKQIHFIFADAVIANSDDAHYSVDWIASFSSVNDLKSFQDWTDEAQEADASLPYHELCFRPKSDGSGYDARKNGFKDVEFEGNYNAGLFAIEYFWVDNFSAGKFYSLVLTSTGNENDLAVWDFPYQINYEISVTDIISYATAVVGVAPRSNSGDINTPIAFASKTDGKWAFAIPASSLTSLATFDGKTLVGLLVTSKEAITSDQKGKFATASHTTKAHPSLSVCPVVNATQNRVESSLADAVSNATANDVITLSDDVTVSAQIDIAKTLTIQGASGEETIICDVPAANRLIQVANSSENYLVTLKNLVIDGQNTSRSTHTIDANNKGQLCFENVSIINTKYSVTTGDVKNNGNNVLLKGVNSFSTGIYLNKNKRVDGKDATHTEPINLVLAGDYEDDYAVVLNCVTPAQYYAIDAAGVTGWQLKKSDSKDELKVQKVDNFFALNVSAAGMATMVIGFDASVPSGVKAYTLEYGNDGTSDIYAQERKKITANWPVLIIAPQGTYVFNGLIGAEKNEVANPTFRALVGTYEDEINIPVSADGVYNYILANGASGVGFYKVPDSGEPCKVTRNHAYLSCGYPGTSGGGSAPMRIRFDKHEEQVVTGFDQLPTDQVQSTNVQKLFINGELFIQRDEHLYSIDGRMVK